MLSLSSTLIIVGLASICAAQEAPCHGALGYNINCKKDWYLGLEHVPPSGTVVHGHIKTPVSSEGVQGTAHGSHVFGGPHNGATSAGAGINYQHPSGIHGGLDVTHNKGQGNIVSANLGGSTKLGPGTLTVQGGANTIPHSGHVEGSVGATYTVPLP